MSGRGVCQTPARSIACNKQCALLVVLVLVVSVTPTLNRYLSTGRILASTASRPTVQCAPTAAHFHRVAKRG